MCRVLQQQQALYQRGNVDRALQALWHAHKPPPTSVYVTLLKHCKKEGSLDQAKQIQAHLARHQISLTGLLGDYLVMTLAYCGSLDDALQVSYTLPHRTVYSWTAIISACVDSGHPLDALSMYQHMLNDHIQPDRYTFVSLLKACGSIPDLALGKRFHADAAQRGIALDVFVGNTLVSMYGKCGEVVEAEKVFHEMPEHTVVSWNSLISAYLDDGRGDMALQLYSQMHAQQSASYDHATSILTLQSCATLVEMNLVYFNRQSIMFSPLDIGQALHADLRKKGFASQIFVASTLVSLYGKCKAIAEAENAFSSLAHHDVVSWNVILAAYVEQGQGQKALQLYVWMQKRGTSPDRMSLMIVLQACAALAEKDEVYCVDKVFTELAPLQIGQALHSDAELIGVASDDFVANTILSMYGKCGAIKEAEQMFCAVLHLDAVAWNAMLSTYVEQGEVEKALNLYSQMQHEGVRPELLTFVIAIQACATLAETDESLLDGGRSLKIGPFEIGKALHADARREGFELDALVGCTLVSMYGKCGAISEAEHMFSALVYRDVVAWNVMLTTYVNRGEGYLVLQLFKHMQEQRVSPDPMTLVTAIQACAHIAEMEQSMERDSSRTLSLEIGKVLHVEACKRGFLSNAFVNNTLINMYGKCGATFEAEHLFQSLPIRTVVSWNAILSAYVERGQSDRALQLHREMQKEGYCTDQLTCVIMLQACASLADEKTALQGRSTRVRALDFGHAIHADALKKGFASDVIVANTLVSMYGKCGDSLQAKYVFDVMPELTIVSWNSMLSAYLEQGNGEESWQLYKQMKSQGLILDHITPVCVLQACSLIGSLEKCNQIHFDIVSGGYDSYSSLNAPLIHAYGSCAGMEQAQGFLDTIIKPDISSWNACIDGYTGEGNHVACLRKFEELNLEGLKPDHVTFTSVLSACSHSGLLLESLGYLESMGRDHGILLDLVHYGSMLDLLGRAGSFNRLESMLNKMPMRADPGIWLCLLGACCTHGNLDLAKLAFDMALCLEPNRSTLYVLMSNIFANGAGLKDLGDVEIFGRGADYCVDESWSDLCATAR